MRKSESNRRTRLRVGRRTMLAGMAGLAGKAIVGFPAIRVQAAQTLTGDRGVIEDV